MSELQIPQLPPVLVMQPYYKSVLWGGQRICKFKNVASTGDNIGESWEVSDMPGAESHVSGDSPLAGMPLRQVVDIYGESLLGPRVAFRYRDRFPLLVKYIDAQSDLSIQVHPDDYLAARRHQCPGKTELWYVVDSEPGAYIYSGLQQSISPEQLSQHIADGSLIGRLAKFYPRRGDIFYLPAGRVHSIGAGNLVLEIQQPSDITYRIFDYDRIDSNGRKRDLHIPEAIEAVDYRVYEDYSRHFEPITNREIVLKECPYFSVSIINVTARYTLPIARYGSFRILMVTRGTAYITDPDGNSIVVTCGTTVIVPAHMDHVVITPATPEAELLTAYII